MTVFRFVYRVTATNLLLYNRTTMANNANKITNRQRDATKTPTGLHCERLKTRERKKSHEISAPRCCLLPSHIISVISMRVSYWTIEFNTDNSRFNKRRMARLRGVVVICQSSLWVWAVHCSRIDLTRESRVPSCKYRHHVWDNLIPKIVTVLT